MRAWRDRKPAVACQQAHQFILRTIGILILVDLQILKLAVVVIADLRRGRQEANGLEQQVVEVHGIGFEQFLAILRIDMRDFLRLGIAGIEINLLRIEHVVLCPGDSGQYGARRKLLIVDAQSPRVLSLFFSEAVEVSAGDVRLYDVDGHRVDVGPPRRANGDTEVDVSVPHLEDGTYTVVWRAVSADSHPVRGG